MAPFADVLYFADAKWWNWHKEKAEYVDFKGERCTIFTTGNTIDDPYVSMVRQKSRDGLSDDPEMICTGSNSGHQIVNIAYLAGAKRIALVGYDAKDGTDSRRHFFGDHPDKTTAPYAHMIAAFRVVAKILELKQVEIYNVTPDSAVDAFPRAPLEDVIRMIQ
jgi:hypothetical protein